MDYYQLDSDGGVTGVSEEKLIEAFHEEVNDEYGSVECLDQRFFVADVLKEMDHTAYRVAFFGWLDREVRAGAVFVKREEAEEAAA